jgi:hypothetical protein
MNSASTFSCQCVDCPGSSCLCGCLADSAPSVALIAAQACTCGSGCGCEAAEQGCLCSARQNGATSSFA